jgi:tRNA (mo5U34)-methyltransferase
MATTIESPVRTVAPEQIAREVAALGDWFHNIDLHGVLTAPNHFLGDYPAVKWKNVRKALPDDLAGASVLDIGCNGGYYSIELKRRGAGRVLAIDVVDSYLHQARYAAATLDLDIEFQKRSVYDVDTLPGGFDIVLFMGVFYHLRYPLLALDKIVKKVKGQLIFQTMLRGSIEPYETKDDYHFWKMDIFSDGAFPAAYFIEKNYSNDPTNWFIPNRSGAEAMLRSSGLDIIDHPESETWVCVPTERTRRNGEYILDLEIAGRL